MLSPSQERRQIPNSDEKQLYLDSVLSCKRKQEYNVTQWDSPWLARILSLPRKLSSSFYPGILPPPFQLLPIFLDLVQLLQPLSAPSCHQRPIALLQIQWSEQQQYAMYFIITAVGKNLPEVASLHHWNAGITDMFRDTLFMLAKIKHQWDIHY